MGEIARPATPAEVIDEYVASAQTPSRAALSEWIARYPEYSGELTDFTVSWARLEWIPGETAPPAEESRLREVAQSIARRKLAAVRQAAAQTEPLPGLLAAARANGLAPAELASQAGLSIPLLTKLDRRLIRAAGVPAAVIERLARALSTGADAVSAYLHGPAMHAAGANFLAGQAPTLPDQQDFFAAVRADRTLSPARRKELLSLEAGDE